MGLAISLGLDLNRGVGSSEANRLPLHTKIAAFGDSITAAGQNLSWPLWANTMCGGRYRFNAGWNFGVGGNNTTQMLARISDVTTYAPSICLVMGGTNDLPGGSATPIANLRSIYNGLIAAGIKVVAMCVLPRSVVGNPSWETARLAVNTFIRAQTDVTVVDCDPVFDHTIHTADGLHPNSRGAFLVGKQLAPALASLISSADVFSDFLGASNMLGAAPAVYSGSTGTRLTGVSGTVATGWQASRPNFTDTGSLVASKSAGDTQVATFGTDNGGQRFTMERSLTGLNMLTGETYEGFYEFSFTGAGLLNDMRVSTTPASPIALQDIGEASFFVDPGTYVVRSMPVALGADSTTLLFRNTILVQNGDPDVVADFKRAYFRKVIP